VAHGPSARADGPSVFMDERSGRAVPPPYWRSGNPPRATPGNHEPRGNPPAALDAPADALTLLEQLVTTAKSHAGSGLADILSHMVGAHVASAAEELEIWPKRSGCARAA
jgi:hypothetical protein